MRKLQIKQLYTQRELSECTIHLMNLQGEKTKKKICHRVQIFFEKNRLEIKLFVFQ